MRQKRVQVHTSELAQITFVLMRMTAVTQDRSKEWMDKGSWLLSKTGTHRFIVRHKRLPATTAICTSRGSQGMPALGGEKKDRHIVKVMGKVMYSCHSI